MSDELRLGWSRHDITPDHPVPLAGYASRAALGPASSVLTPLHLRVIALRQGDRTVVIMVGDLLWFGPDNMARIESSLRDRYGLAPEQLIVNGTHTHSGPQPSSWFAVGLGDPDPSWVDSLHDHVVAATGEALASSVPVTMAIAQAPYRLGVERRFARSGGRERAAHLQQQLSVITFRAADAADEIVAIAMHHACHPTLHSDNAITADFAGAAADSLEAAGDARIALYLQGCCGNVNPDAYDGTQFQHGGLPEITAMGEGLAVAVRAILGDGVEVAPSLTWARRDVAVPTEPAPEVAELERLAGLGLLKESGWARLLLERPERRAASPLRLSRIGLGEDLQLIGLGAEVTSPYANHVTEVFGPRALTLGYCNGMLTYLVTAEQLADGGYEPDDAPFWFGMPGRFTPEVEATVYEGLDAVGVDRA